MYESLPLSLARAKERAGATDADSGFLTEMLELSKGIRKSDQVAVYRPFFVAAKHLEQNPMHQRVSKADDAVFTGMKTAIASLFALQASLDKDLVVPIGFEVPIEFVPETKAASQPARYRSTSIQSRSNP